jgi:maleylpyruvate isomerase
MNSRDSSRDLDRDVEGCAAAHQRLLADLDDLTDEQARQASLLPDWTVGHVLTHIARNGDAFTRMLESADRGESVEMYEGGFDARAAAIEAGASRSARELVADVRRSIYALEGQWASTTETGWDGTGIGVFGEIPMADVPFRRWREVEVHHIDLGLAATIADWSPLYVRLELERMTMAYAARRPMGLTELPPEALALAPHERLAWLLGRREIEGLAPASVFG